jgi:hypothetical protein
LNKPSLSLIASLVLLAATAFAVTVVAQTPSPRRPHHKFPPPTNLQVLPKNLTGDQVHQIMEGWAHALGTHCSTCHAVNPNANGPLARRRLDFALDTKPEKATARMMYEMVQEINTHYINRINTSGMPVTCATCHRGHLSPPLYLPHGGRH